MGKSHRSILSVTGTVPPPRRPNDDDDDGDTDGFKIHRGVLGLEEAEGTALHRSGGISYVTEKENSLPIAFGQRE